MLTLRNAIAVALASTYVTIQIGALPHPQQAHQQRAVDVTAFTPWEEHPSHPAKAKSADAQPAETQSAGAQPAESQPTIDSLGTTQSPDPKKTTQINDDTKGKGPDRKRANNPEGFVPYLHIPTGAAEPDMKRAVDPSALLWLDHERTAAAPIEERDDYQTVVDENRDEKPVNVVPIVGRTAAKRESGSFFSMEGVDNVERRDIDPIATIEENRNEKAVNVVPIVGRAAEKRSLDSDLAENSPSSEEKRDIDPIATIEENRNEKAVNVVPIVGRGAQPSEPEKREAIPNPEAISDKLSCDGERYLPSQQTCTPAGLVSLTAPTPTTTASDDSSSTSALKLTRAAVTAAQCGSGIGSITYDRSTSYCDPITKQVSPIVPMTAQTVNSQQNSASSAGSRLVGLGQQQPEGQRRGKRDSMSLYGPDGE